MVSHVQWVTKVMTPASIRNTVRKGSGLLCPTVQAILCQFGMHCPACGVPFKAGAEC